MGPVRCKVPILKTDSNFPLSSNFLIYLYVQHKTNCETECMVIDLICTQFNNYLGNLQPNILWNFIIDLKEKKRISGNSQVEKELYLIYIIQGSRCKYQPGCMTVCKTLTHIFVFWLNVFIGISIMTSISVNRVIFTNFFYHQII